MPLPELIQERLISGKGVLKVPEDKQKVRTYILYVDVIREPKSKYLNLAYNPGRSRYGTINFFRNGYVIGSVPVEYPRQSFDGVNDISGQVLNAVKCAYTGTLESFNRLAGALGLTVLPYTDLIRGYENLRLSWTEARVVCYADTALQVRLYSTEYDICGESEDKDQPPPPPPPPLPPVPPGTPIGSLSPPYEEDDSDEGNTEPYDGDESEPDEPEFPVCSIVAVVVNLKIEGFSAFNSTYRVYAEYGGVRINPASEFSLQIFCQGAAGGTCLPTADWRDIDSTSARIESFFVVSVTLEP